MMTWVAACSVLCLLATTCQGLPMSASSPGGHKLAQTPQFVMPTFDDAVNVINMELYKEIFMGGKKNKGDGSNVHATFYVTHDYTNYQYVHKLYIHGNEIAVHSISHITSTEYWKTAEKDVWKMEMEGMRTILSQLAKIPESEIVGSRAPFLQTAGDIYFRMLKDSGFKYDSSMPSRFYNDNPIWPYNMENGFQHDCQIEPCPQESYGGLYLVPMINYNNGGFFCAMADACVPLPKTIEETLDYLKSNFYRHYQTTKAPFPLFLHQAWLQDEARREAYIQFIDWLTEKEDVFLVSVKEVLDYLEKPVSLDEYKNRAVATTPLPDGCKTSKTCYYKDTAPSGSRYMVRCGQTCTRSFPWVGNPEGR